MKAAEQIWTPGTCLAQSGTALPSASAPSAVPDDLQRAVAEFEMSAEFLRSRFMERLIATTITAAVLRAASPLCDRNGAAALALCSVDQIDAAEKAGIITRHLRGETPLYEKAAIVEAITSGRWRFSKPKTTQNYER